MQLADQAARDQAIDVSQSYLVQAPAGSGKTTLLVMRYLALLAKCVQNPEECLAITFTRKAAAEMRHRVCAALKLASESESGLEDANVKLISLAKQVLEQDKKLAWRLLENPSRLRIQTIDALCASLVNQMPVVAGFGHQPEVTDSPAILYNLAVEQFFKSIYSQTEYATEMATVMSHLDNDYAKAQQLFLSLLPARDQWLQLVLTGGSNALKKYLENSLQQAALDIIKNALDLAPDAVDDFFNLVQFAAKNLSDLGVSSPIIACAVLSHWPAAETHALPAWQGLAELLLTRQDTLRKTVTQKQGFNAATAAVSKEQKAILKENKQQMLQWLQCFDQSPEFIAALGRIKTIPALKYNATQWEFINALFKVLPLLVSELYLVFKSQAKVDFVQLSLSALKALGEHDAPTDLALRLDYKIQHILVDEFQDTSLTQFDLITQLTAGWQAEEGRTLFLVGDPMQSIYRFRHAEVGVFMQAKQAGVGAIQLKFIHLSSNFRSNANIVNWNNHIFSSVFPRHADMTQGAIPYLPSTPVHMPEPDSQVECMRVSGANWQQQEGLFIAKKILQLRETNPTQKIAILVRSRSHLQTILPALRNAEIVYQGVGLESLLERMVIQDLLSLTRALCHLGDRTAWLAILRAPWCGLSLVDLTTLTAALNADEPVWQALQTFEHHSEQLSRSGLQRLRAVVPILFKALKKQGKLPIHQWVQKTWQALGGLNCLQTEQQVRDTAVFFETLATCGTQREILNLDYVEEQIANLFAESNDNNLEAVQVMTMHKAKGLEFDTVILPGLGRKPISDATQLMLWERWQSNTEEPYLLLAPIKAANQASDPIYRFVKNNQQLRAHQEAKRLLYVASTRAKSRLICIAHIEKDQPTSGSLLDYLGENNLSKFKVTTATEKANLQASNLEFVNAQYQIEPISNASRKLQRLPEYYFSEAPVFIPESSHVLDSDDTDAQPEVALQQTISTQFITEQGAKAIGTLVHEIFWRIATGQMVIKHVQQITKYREFWMHQLRPTFSDPKTLITAYNLVEKAVSNTLKDAKGQWLLNAEHIEHYAEWSLSYVQNGQSKHIVVDRLIVEPPSDVWLVDYKVCLPDADLDTTKYYDQLQKYHRVVSSLYPNHKIRLAIYYPIQMILHEVHTQPMHIEV